MAFSVVDIQRISLSWSEAKRVKRHSSGSSRVDTSQVDDELVVDEDPEVIV